MQYQILVVDDDALNLMSSRYLLEQWGYRVETAKGGDEAIRILQTSREAFAVVLLDYRMPGKDGPTTAREIRTFNNESIILMYSGDDSRDAIKETYKAGAVDFIEKGENNDELKLAIERYCRKYEETSRTLRTMAPKTSTEELIASIGMVGRSQAMADIAMQVVKYRAQRKPVLILGNTGTGKELIARALHNGPSETFFAINCAAYTDKPQLLESELFGYEKGAFTGATTAKAGTFQVAKGGSVLLDELPHLSRGAQAQLLRALQEKKIRRVGASQEIDVDFRLIAAAKPDLDERVKRNEFLSDFYYRLNYLRIDVPDLCERPEDIEPLVSHFCEKYFQETGQRKTFLMRTVRMMEKHSWPGNIRELEAYVYRLMVKSAKDTIDPSLLDGRFFDESEASKAMSYAQLEQKQENEKRSFILSVLKTSDSKAHAAEKLKLKPTTLYSMLERFKIGVESV